MLAVLLLVGLVVVLLSCFRHCLCLLCCRVANTAAAATVVTPLLQPPPSVGKEEDACYTNTDSSPATPAEAVCRALETARCWTGPSRPFARAAKVATMMAAPMVVAEVGSRTGLVWSSPPPPEGARRQQGWKASEGRGNEEENCNSDEGGEQ